MSKADRSRDPVIELPPSSRHSRRTITDCKWKLRTFVERDAYVVYHHAAGYARTPHDRIQDFHIHAINSVMRARSSRKAWAEVLDQPLPELARIPAEFDLIDSPDGDFHGACEALRDLVDRLTSIPSVTEMAVSKVIHLLRPRFVSIADAYVRDCFGLSRGAAPDTMIAVQAAAGCGGAGKYGCPNPWEQKPVNAHPISRGEP